MEHGDNEIFLKDTYEIQLLEFSSRIVSDCVTSIASDHIERTAASLQDILLKNVKHSQSEIQTATNNFIKDSTIAAVHQLKDLMKTVDEFFAIPSYILLPEDVAQSVQYNAEEEQCLDREIEQLKARANRANFIEGHLRKEIEVLQKLTKLVSEHKDLENLYNEDEAHALSTLNLHSKVNEIVEVTKVMKSVEKTCFDFPKGPLDKGDVIGIKDKFERL